MIQVYLRKDETFESMMRRFKKLCEKANIVKEVKNRQYYIPPSEKRRIKSAEARKRAKKKTKPQQ